MAWRRKDDKPLPAPMSTQLTKVTMDPSSVIIWKLWKWTEVCGPTLLCGIVSRRQSKYDWYFICNRFSHAPHPSRWTHVFMLVEAEIWSTRTCRNCTVHNVSYSGTRQNISLSAHYIYIYIYMYIYIYEYIYTVWSEYVHIYVQSILRDSCQFITGILLFWVQIFSATERVNDHSAFMWCFGPFFMDRLSFPCGKPKVSCHR